MKKKYVKPEIERVELNFCDIVAASGGESEPESTKDEPESSAGIGNVVHEAAAPSTNFWDSGASSGGDIGEY